MTNRRNRTDPGPIVARFEEDLDRLVHKVAKRLAQVGGRDKPARRQPTWFLIASLILLALGGGLFLW